MGTRLKTRELVKQLQEADPTGELEVTVGKTDIHFLQTLPGYYDGYYEVLVRDENLIDCYNVVGAEIRGTGYHVCIETFSIQDMLHDDPSAPVTIIGSNPEPRQARVDEWRAAGRLSRGGVD